MLKRIVNGTVVGPDSVYPDHQVLIDGTCITHILPSAAELPQSFCGADVEVIDADGAYVTPGFIDTHSDYIEHMASPRPGTLLDFGLALHEVERQLLMHGISMMYHSLSFNDTTVFKKKEIRMPNHTAHFAQILANCREASRLIHHRLHVRFELTSVYRVDELKEYMREAKVHLLSFTDHTPGQGQYHDVEVYRRTMKGYSNISDEELDRAIDRSQTNVKVTHDVMKELVALADEHGVSVASHDDDTLEKLAFNRDLGLSISEFPMTLEVAECARELGFFTVAGAPNVLLGGSHNGNLSATAAIKAGAIDVLCSDYYPASLLHAVFQLHEEDQVDLAQAFRLVTLNPAKALGIDARYGSISPGKSADILIIRRLSDGFPSVDYAFIEGQQCLHTRYRRNDESSRIHASITEGDTRRRSGRA